MPEEGGGQEQTQSNENQVNQTGQQQAGGDIIGGALPQHAEQMAQQVEQQNPIESLRPGVSSFIQEATNRANQIVAAFEQDPDKFIEYAAKVRDDLLRMKGFTYAMMPYTDVLFRKPVTFGSFLVPTSDEDRIKGFEEYYDFLQETSGSKEDVGKLLEYQRNIFEGILKVTGQIRNIYDLIHNDDDRTYYLENCVGKKGGEYDDKCATITQNLNKLLLGGPTIGEYELLYASAAGRDKKELKNDIYWTSFWAGLKSSIPFVGSAEEHHKLETLQRMAFYAGAGYDEITAGIIQGVAQVIPTAVVTLASILASGITGGTSLAGAASAMRTAAGLFSMSSGIYAAYDASKLNEEEAFMEMLNDFAASGLHSAKLTQKYVEIMKAKGMGYELIDEAKSIFRDLSKVEIAMSGDAEQMSMWRDMMDNIETGLQYTFAGSMVTNAVLEMTANVLQFGTSITAASLKRSVLADFVNSTPMLRSMANIASRGYGIATSALEATAYLYNPLKAFFEHASAKGSRAFVVGFASEFFEEATQEMLEKVATNMGSAIAIKSTFEDWQKYSSAANAYYINKMSQLEKANQWVLLSGLEAFADISAWQEALIAGLSGGIAGGVTTGINTLIGHKVAMVMANRAMAEVAFDTINNYKDEYGLAGEKDLTQAAKIAAAEAVVKYASMAPFKNTAQFVEAVKKLKNSRSFNKRFGGDEQLKQAVLKEMESLANALSSSPDLVAKLDNTFKEESGEAGRYERHLLLKSFVYTELQNSISDNLRKHDSFNMAKEFNSVVDDIEGNVLAYDRAVVDQYKNQNSQDYLSQEEYNQLITDAIQNGQYLTDNRINEKTRKFVNTIVQMVNSLHAAAMTYAPKNQAQRQALTNSINAFAQQLSQWLVAVMNGVQTDQLEQTNNTLQGLVNQMKTLASNIMEAYRTEITERGGLPENSIKSTLDFLNNLIASIDTMLSQEIAVQAAPGTEGATAVGEHTMLNKLMRAVVALNALAESIDVGISKAMRANAVANNTVTTYVDDLYDKTELGKSVMHVNKAQGYALEVSNINKKLEGGDLEGELERDRIVDDNALRIVRTINNIRDLITYLNTSGLNIPFFQTYIFNAIRAQIAALTNNQIADTFIELLQNELEEMQSNGEGAGPAVINVPSILANAVSQHLTSNQQSNQSLIGVLNSLGIPYENLHEGGNVSQNLAQVLVVMMLHRENVPTQVIQNSLSRYASSISTILSKGTKLTADEFAIASKNKFFLRMRLVFNNMFRIQMFQTARQIHESYRSVSDQVKGLIDNIEFDANIESIRTKIRELENKAKEAKDESKGHYDAAVKYLQASLEVLQALRDLHSRQKDQEEPLKKLIDALAKLRDARSNLDDNSLKLLSDVRDTVAFLSRVAGAYAELRNTELQIIKTLRLEKEYKVFKIWRERRKLLRAISSNDKQGLFNFFLREKDGFESIQRLAALEKRYIAMAGSLATYAHRAGRSYLRSGYNTQATRDAVYAQIETVNTTIVNARNNLGNNSSFYSYDSSGIFGDTLPDIGPNETIESYYNRQELKSIVKNIDDRVEALYAHRRDFARRIATILNSSSVEHGRRMLIDLIILFADRERARKDKDKRYIFSAEEANALVQNFLDIIGEQGNENLEQFLIHILTNNNEGNHMTFAQYLSAAHEQSNLYLNLLEQLLENIIMTATGTITTVSRQGNTRMIINKADVKTESYMVNAAAIFYIYDYIFRGTRALEESSVIEDLNTVDKIIDEYNKEASRKRVDESASNLYGEIINRKLESFLERVRGRDTVKDELLDKVIQELKNRTSTLKGFIDNFINHEEFILAIAKAESASDVYSIIERFLTRLNTDSGRKELKDRIIAEIRGALLSAGVKEEDINVLLSSIDDVAESIVSELADAGASIISMLFADSKDTSTSKVSSIRQKLKYLHSLSTKVKELVSETKDTNYLGEANFTLFDIDLPPISDNTPYHAFAVYDHSLVSGMTISMSGGRLIFNYGEGEQQHSIYSGIPTENEIRSLAKREDINFRARFVIAHLYMLGYSENKIKSILGIDFEGGKVKETSGDSSKRINILYNMILAMYGIITHTATNIANQQQNNTLVNLMNTVAGLFGANQNSTDQQLVTLINTINDNDFSEHLNSYGIDVGFIQSNQEELPSLFGEHIGYNQQSGHVGLFDGLSRVIFENIMPKKMQYIVSREQESTVHDAGYVVMNTLSAATRLSRGGELNSGDFTLIKKRVQKSALDNIIPYSKVTDIEDHNEVRVIGDDINTLVDVSTDSGASSVQGRIGARGGADIWIIPHSRTINGVTVTESNLSQALSQGIGVDDLYQLNLPTFELYDQTLSNKMPPMFTSVASLDNYVTDEELINLTKGVERGNVDMSKDESFFMATVKLRDTKGFIKKIKEIIKKSRKDVKESELDNLIQSLMFNSQSTVDNNYDLSLESEQSMTSSFANMIFSSLAVALNSPDGTTRAINVINILNEITQKLLAAHEAYKLALEHSEMSNDEENIEKTLMLMHNDILLMAYIVFNIAESFDYLGNDSVLQSINDFFNELTKPYKDRASAINKLANVVKVITHVAQSSTQGNTALSQAIAGAATEIITNIEGINIGVGINKIAGGYNMSLQSEVGDQTGEVLFINLSANDDFINKLNSAFSHVTSIGQEEQVNNLYAVFNGISEVKHAVRNMPNNSKKTIVLRVDNQNATRRGIGLVVINLSKDSNGVVHFNVSNIVNTTVNEMEVTIEHDFSFIVSDTGTDKPLISKFGQPVKKNEPNSIPHPSNYGAFLMKRNWKHGGTAGQDYNITNIDGLSNQLNNIRTANQNSVVFLDLDKAKVNIKNHRQNVYANIDNGSEQHPERYYNFNQTYAGAAWLESTTPIIVSRSTNDIKKNVAVSKQFQHQAKKTAKIGQSLASYGTARMAPEETPINFVVDMYTSLNTLYNKNDGVGNVAAAAVFNELLQNGSRAQEVDSALQILHSVIHSEGFTINTQDENMTEFIAAYNHLSGLYTRESAEAMNVRNEIWDYIFGQNNPNTRAVRIAAFMFMLYERAMSQYSMAKVVLDNAGRLDTNKVDLDKAAAARKSAVSSLNMLAAIITRLVSNSETHSENAEYRTLGYSMYLAVMKLYNTTNDELSAAQTQQAQQTLVNQMQGREHLVYLSRLNNMNDVISDITFKNTTKDKVFIRLNNTLLSTVYSTWVAENHPDPNSSHAILFTNIALPADQTNENLIAKLGIAGNYIGAVAETSSALTMKEMLSMVYFLSLPNGARTRIMDSTLSIPARASEIDATLDRLSQNPVIDINYVAMSLLKDMNKMLGGKILFALSHVILFASKESGNSSIKDNIIELAKDAEKVKKALESAGIIENLEEEPQNRKNNVLSVASIKKFIKIINQIYDLQSLISQNDSLDQLNRASSASNILSEKLGEFLSALREAGMGNTQIYKYAEVLFQLVKNLPGNNNFRGRDRDLIMKQAINNFNSMLNLTIDAIHTAVSTINSTKSNTALFQSITEEGAKSIEEMKNAIRELTDNKGSDRKAKNIALLFRKTMEMSEIDGTFASSSMWQFGESNGSEFDDKVRLKSYEYYLNNRKEFAEVLANIIDNLMEGALSGTVDYGSRLGNTLYSGFSDEDIRTIMSAIVVLQYGYDAAKQAASKFGLTAEDIDNVFKNDDTKNKLLDALKEFIHKSYTFYLLRFDEEGNVEGGQVKSNLYDEKLTTIDYEPLPAIHFSDKGYLIEFKIVGSTKTMSYREVEVNNKFQPQISNSSAVQKFDEIKDIHVIPKVPLSDAFRTAEPTIYNPQADMGAINSVDTHPADTEQTLPFEILINNSNLHYLLANIATRISDKNTSASDKIAVLSILRTVTNFIKDNFTIAQPDGQSINLKEVLNELINSLDIDVASGEFVHEQEDSPAIRSGIANFGRTLSSRNAQTNSPELFHYLNSGNRNARALLAIALGILNPSKVSLEVAAEILNANNFDNILREIYNTVNEDGHSSHSAALLVSLAIYGAMVLKHHYDNVIYIEPNSAQVNGTNSFSDNSTSRGEMKESSISDVNPDKYSLFISPNNGWVISRKRDVLEQEIGESIVSEHDLKNLIADQADIMFDHKYAPKIGRILIDIFRALRAELTNPYISGQAGRNALFALVDQLITERSEGAENIMAFLSSDNLKNMLVELALAEDLELTMDGNKVVIRNNAGSTRNNLEFAVNILTEESIERFGYPKWKTVITDDLLVVLRAAYRNSTLMNKYNLSESAPKNLMINFWGTNYNFSVSIIHDYASGGTENTSSPGGNLSEALFHISERLDGWYNDLNSSEVRNREYKANKYKEMKIKVFNSMLMNVIDYTSGSLYTLEKEISEDVVKSLWDQFKEALSWIIANNKNITEQIAEAISNTLTMNVQLNQIDDINKIYDAITEKAREEKEKNKDVITGAIMLRVLNDIILNTYQTLIADARLYSDPKNIAIIYNMNRLYHIMRSFESAKDEEVRVLNLRNKNVKRAVIYALHLSDELTAQGAKFTLNYSSDNTRNTNLSIFRVNVGENNNIEGVNRESTFKKSRDAFARFRSDNYTPAQHEYMISTTVIDPAPTVNRIVEMLERHVFSARGKNENISYIIREDTANFLLQLAMSTIVHASLHGISDGNDGRISLDAYTAALNILNLFIESTRNLMASRSDNVAGLRGADIIRNFSNTIINNLLSSDSRNSTITMLRNIAGGKFIDTFSISGNIGGTQINVSLNHNHIFGGLMNHIVTSSSNGFTPGGIMNYLANLIAPNISNNEETIQYINQLFEQHATHLASQTVNNQSMNSVVQNIMTGGPLVENTADNANRYTRLMRQLKVLSYYDAMDGALTNNLFVSIQKANKRALQQAGTSSADTTLRIAFVSDMEAPLFQGAGVSGGFVLQSNRLIYYPIGRAGQYDVVPHGQDDILAIIAHYPTDMAQWETKIRSALNEYTNTTGRNLGNLTNSILDAILAFRTAENEYFSGYQYGSAGMDAFLTSEQTADGQTRLNAALSIMHNLSSSHENIVNDLATYMQSDTSINPFIKIRLLKMALTQRAVSAFSAQSIANALQQNNGNTNDLIYNIAHSLYNFMQILVNESNIIDDEHIIALRNAAEDILSRIGNRDYIGADDIDIEFANAFFHALGSSSARQVLTSLMYRATNGDVNMNGFLVNFVQLASLQYFDLATPSGNNAQRYSGVLKLKADLSIIYNLIDISGKLLEGNNGQLFNNTDYHDFMMFVNSSHLGVLLNDIEDSIIEHVNEALNSHIASLNINFKAGNLEREFMDTMREIVLDATAFSYLRRMSSSIRSQSVQNDSFSYVAFSDYYRLLAKTSQGTKDAANVAWKLQGHMARNMHLSIVSTQNGRYVKSAYGERIATMRKTNRLFREDEVMSLGKLLEDANMLLALDQYLSTPGNQANNIEQQERFISYLLGTHLHLSNKKTYLGISGNMSGSGQQNNYIPLLTAEHDNINMANLDQQVVEYYLSSVDLMLASYVREVLDAISNNNDLSQAIAGSNVSKEVLLGYIMDRMLRQLMGVDDVGQVNGIDINNIGAFDPILSNNELVNQLNLIINSARNRYSNLISSIAGAFGDASSPFGVILSRHLSVMYSSAIYLASGQGVDAHTSTSGIELDSRNLEKLAARIYGNAVDYNLDALTYAYATSVALGLYMSQEQQEQQNISDLLTSANSVLNSNAIRDIPGMEALDNLRTMLSDNGLERFRNMLNMAHKIMQSKGGRKFNPIKTSMNGYGKLHVDHVFQVKTAVQLMSHISSEDFFLRSNNRVDDVMRYNVGVGTMLLQMMEEKRNYNGSDKNQISVVAAKSALKVGNTPNVIDPTHVATGINGAVHTSTNGASTQKAQYAANSNGITMESAQNENGHQVNLNTFRRLKTNELSDIMHVYAADGAEQFFINELNDHILTTTSASLSPLVPTGTRDNETEIPIQMFQHVTMQLIAFGGNTKELADVVKQISHEFDGDSDMITESMSAFKLSRLAGTNTFNVYHHAKMYRQQLGLKTIGNAFSMRNTVKFTAGIDYLGGEIQALTPKVRVPMGGHSSVAFPEAEFTVIDGMHGHGVFQGFIGDDGDGDAAYVMMMYNLYSTVDLSAISTEEGITRLYNALNDANGDPSAYGTHMTGVGILLDQELNIMGNDSMREFVRQLYVEGFMNRAMLRDALLRIRDVMRSYKTITDELNAMLGKVKAGSIQDAFNVINRLNDMQGNGEIVGVGLVYRYFLVGRMLPALLTNEVTRQAFQTYLANNVTGDMSYQDLGQLVISFIQENTSQSNTNEFREIKNMLSNELENFIKNDMSAFKKDIANLYGVTAAYTLTGSNIDTAPSQSNTETLRLVSQRAHKSKYFNVGGRSFTNMTPLFVLPFPKEETNKQSKQGIGQAAIIEAALHMTRGISVVSNIMHYYNLELPGLDINITYGNEDYKMTLDPTFTVQRNQDFVAMVNIVLDLLKYPDGANVTYEAYSSIVGLFLMTRNQNLAVTAASMPVFHNMVRFLTKNRKILEELTNNIDGNTSFYNVIEFLKSKIKNMPKDQFVEPYEKGIIEVLSEASLKPDDRSLNLDTIRNQNDADNNTKAKIAALAALSMIVGNDLTTIGQIFSINRSNNVSNKYDYAAVLISGLNNLVEGYETGNINSNQNANSSRFVTPNDGVIEGAIGEILDTAGIPVSFIGRKMIKDAIHAQVVKPSSANVAHTFDMQFVIMNESLKEYLEEKKQKYFDASNTESVEGLKKYGDYYNDRARKTTSTMAFAMYIYAINNNLSDHSYNDIINLLNSKINNEALSDEDKEFINDLKNLLTKANMAQEAVFGDAAKAMFSGSGEQISNDINLRMNSLRELENEMTNFANKYLKNINKMPDQTASKLLAKVSDNKFTNIGNFIISKLASMGLGQAANSFNSIDNNTLNILTGFVKNISDILSYMESKGKEAKLNSQSIKDNIYIGAAYELNSLLLSDVMLGLYDAKIFGNNNPFLGDGQPTINDVNTLTTQVLDGFMDIVSSQKNKLAKLRALFSGEHMQLLTHFLSSLVLPGFAVEPHSVDSNLIYNESSRSSAANSAISYAYQMRNSYKDWFYGSKATKRQDVRYIYYQGVMNLSRRVHDPREYEEGFDLYSDRGVRGGGRGRAFGSGSSMSTSTHREIGGNRETVLIRRGGDVTIVGEQVVGQEGQDVGVEGITPGEGVGVGVGNAIAGARRRTGEAGGGRRAAGSEHRNRFNSQSHSESRNSSQIPMIAASVLKFESKKKLNVSGGEMISVFSSRSRAQLPVSLGFIPMGIGSEVKKDKSC